MFGVGRIVRKVDGWRVSPQVAFVTLVAAAAASAGVWASASSATVFYCNQEVAAYTWCPQFDNYPVTGLGTHNQSYAQDATGLVNVCERATIRYQAPNVSFRCSSSPADSECDLSEMGYGVTLSMYTADDDSIPWYIVGKVYIGDVCA
jgi:hypothetical protein